MQSATTIRDWPRYELVVIWSHLRWNAEMHKCSYCWQETGVSSLQTTLTFPTHTVDKFHCDVATAGPFGRCPPKRGRRVGCGGRSKVPPITSAALALSSTFTSSAASSISASAPPDSDPGPGWQELSSLWDCEAKEAEELKETTSSSSSPTSMIGASPAEPSRWPTGSFPRLRPRPRPRPRPPRARGLDMIRPPACCVKRQRQVKCQWQCCEPSEVWDENKPGPGPRLFSYILQCPESTVESQITTMWLVFGTIENMQGARL